MSVGRTIKIYLSDGSISGVRHVEIVNWTGQAIAAPRALIKKLKDWDELRRPGVYFLFGIDADTGESAVYIGEAENVFDRLQNHVTNKDFWNDVVLFTSKDENITKSHVKYLESRLVGIAKEVNRFRVLNGNVPQEAVLSRSEKDSVEEFLTNLKTVIGVLGYKVLEKLVDNLNTTTQETNADSEEKTFYFETKSFTAKAVMNNEGFVVLSGSQVQSEVKDTLSPGYLKIRNNLIEKNIIQEVNGNHTFTSDYLFTSPSQAAAIITGYPTNGRVVWKLENGKSLKELEDESSIS